MDQLAFHLEFQKPVKEEFENSESRFGLEQDSQDDYFLPPEPNPPERYSFQCPVKFEYTADEEATNDIPVEDVAIPELVEQNVVHIEAKNEPIDELEQPAPDNLAAIKNIKEEQIEFGDDAFTCFETDTADEYPPVDELKIEDVAVELQTPQEPASDEFDTLDVKPALETNVSEETHVFKELVICLEKLDYSAFVEPSSSKKRLPRMACEHCGQTFAKQYRLAQHRVRKHGSTETPTKIKLPPKSTLPPSYHCEQCDKSYNFEFKLRDHKERVHGITQARERPAKHSCKHCGQKLVSWPNLIKHLKAFHGETFDESQIVRCPSCSKMFLTEEARKEHVCHKGIIRVREPRERSFKCDLCSKTYSFLLHLEAHYSVHPEYQNFKCDQCSMGFFNERELGKHKKNVHVDPEMGYMRVHNNDRRYKCSFAPCEKVFRTSGCLKTHEQTHTKDYKYKCKFCSYGAVRPILVTLHEQRNHSEAGDEIDS